MSLKTASFSGEVKDAAKEISKVANNKDGIGAILNDFLGNCETSPQF